MDVDSENEEGGMAMGGGGVDEEKEVEWESGDEWDDRQEGIGLEWSLRAIAVAGLRSSRRSRGFEHKVSHKVRLLPVPPSGSARTDVCGNFHYRLPLKVFEEVDKQPPVYTHIRRLLFLCPRPKRGEVRSEMCSCKESCGDECLNRAVRTECVGKAGESNCAVGPGCGNRAIQEARRPKLAPKRTPGKGWGVMCKEDLKDGDFIIEYVGEVVDDAERQRREDEAAAKKETHHYVMLLDNGLWVDARWKGNVARFINHSCDPNCEVHKVDVNGHSRLVIYAIKDIPAGEELTYDYKFLTKHRTRCCCGAPSCRGFLGTNIAREEKEDARVAMEALRWDDAAKNKIVTAKDRHAFARARKAAIERDKALYKLQVRDDISRHDATCSHAPGDPSHPLSRPVLRSDIEYARAHRLFLSRNVRADWLQRAADRHIDIK